MSSKLSPKLEKRDLDKFKSLKKVKNMDTIKLFEVIDGEIESWEKIGL